YQHCRVVSRCLSAPVPQRLPPPYLTRRSTDLAWIAVGAVVQPLGRTQHLLQPLLQVGALLGAHALQQGLHFLNERLEQVLSTAQDRKSTRLNSSDVAMSVAFLCMK